MIVEAVKGSLRIPSGSPVRAASEQTRLSDSSTIASAGIVLPSEMMRMSPTTNYSEFSSTMASFLRTAMLLSSDLLMSC